MKRFGSLFLIFFFFSTIVSAQKKYDLESFSGKYSPKTVGDQLVGNYLKTKYAWYGNINPLQQLYWERQGGGMYVEWEGTPPPEKTPRMIGYPEVCVWLGALWYSEAAGDQENLTALAERFEPLITTDKYLQPIGNHVDNNVFGAIPLQLYLNKPDERYLKVGLDYATEQWTLPPDATEKEKEYDQMGYSWQTRLWLDDMFMITSLQARAYKATKDPAYLDRAAREMCFYLDQIQLENGLFHHAPKAKYLWGRGNGWMAVGMSEVLKELPADHPNRPRIMEGYKLMMKTLAKYQEDNGMWRQLIDGPDTFEETSGTAMFTCAMILGVKNGWLSKKKYGEAARKGWMALVNHLDENGELGEICCGTNKHPDRDHYLTRPRLRGDLHGQAAMIWCAAALMENNTINQ